VIRAQPAPRLSACRRRAWSIRIRRIAWAASAKKCARFFHVLHDQLQIGLVHQRGRHQRVPARLAPQVTARQPTQFVVHLRQQPVDRRLRTVRGREQQLRGCLGRMHPIRVPFG